MTRIVVANRNGLAEAPDGSKHRLVRGRTLADARHPLPQAHPDLFSEYSIDLPYDDEPDAGDSATERGDVPSWPEKVAEAESIAIEYRNQLASIVEILHDRGIFPSDTEEPGWLARAVAAAIDGESDAEETAAPDLPKLPPRKRAPRRAAVAVGDE